MKTNNDSYSSEAAVTSVSSELDTVSSLKEEQRTEGFSSPLTSKWRCIVVTHGKCCLLGGIVSLALSPTGSGGSEEI